MAARELRRDEPAQRMTLPLWQRLVAGPDPTGTVWALYQDPGLMALSGKTLIGAEIGAKYGILDKGGVQPLSYREMLGVAPHEQYPAVIQ